VGAAKDAATAERLTKRVEMPTIVMILIVIAVLMIRIGLVGLVVSYHEPHLRVGEMIAHPFILLTSSRQGGDST
jgi:hypothetical protein